MARYQGIKKTTREKLNRSIACAGSGGRYTMYWYTGAEALARVFPEIDELLGQMDLRTARAKSLNAAIKRLRILQKEIRR